MIAKLGPEHARTRMDFTMSCDDLRVMPASELSIILLTYNSCKELDLCLSSLEKQTCDMRSIQVVIIDDGSDDETSIVVGRYQNSLKINCYKIEHTGNRGENRNLGASYAEGSHLLFVDGDGIFEPEFIEKHLKYTRKGENLLVMGRRYRIFPVNEDAITADWISRNHDMLNQLPAIDDERLLAIETIREFNLDGEQVFAMVFSHNFSIRKTEFERSGGFDSAFAKYWGAEDVELGYRLREQGTRIVYDDSIVSYHFFKASDIVPKILQLRKNLKYFFGKHQNWEVELASIEHRIWPRRYLLTREKVRMGKHILKADEYDARTYEDSLMIGFSLDNIPCGSISISTHPKMCVKNSNFELIGMDLTSVPGRFKKGFISKNYMCLGDLIFETVCKEAQKKCESVVVCDKHGIVSNQRLTSEIWTNDIGELTFAMSKRVIFTVSDAIPNDCNKYFAYKLALALKGVGVDVALFFSGDMKGDLPKFNGFCSALDAEAMLNISQMYEKDFSLIDEDIPNVMDGNVIGVNGKSIGKKWLWQEIKQISGREYFYKHQAGQYDKIVLRRQGDSDGANDSSIILPAGVDKEQLLKLPPPTHSGGTHILWISNEFTPLSGGLEVVRAWKWLECKGIRARLTIIIPPTPKRIETKFLNDAAWQYLRSMDTKYELLKRDALDELKIEVGNAENVEIIQDQLSEEEINRAISEATLVVDTSPNDKIFPWILNAYALGKQVIRFDDETYHGYFEKSEIILMKYEKVLGYQFGSQFEGLVYGATSPMRFHTYKKAIESEVRNALGKAVSNFGEGKNSKHRGRFINEFDWKVIATAFKSKITNS